jgi:hypothetical protein
MRQTRIWIEDAGFYSKVSARHGISRRSHLSEKCLRTDGNYLQGQQELLFLGLCQRRHSGRNAQRNGSSICGTEFDVY